MLRQVQRVLPYDWQHARRRERGGGMTGLKPIEDGSSPEVRALAQALRDLFKGLGVSARRYGIRRSYDSGTVSRYLAGRRMPPWKFVLDLLHDVAEERGGALPTEETVAMLRALHTAAVDSGGGTAHKVQVLERRLAEADRVARGAATRERALEEALQDREHRIRDLRLRERELRAAASSFGALDGEPPSGEYARLHEEIQDLTAELGRVRDLHRQAEERCERLERRLAEAEAEAEVEMEAEGEVELRAVVPVERPVRLAAEANPAYRFGHVSGDVTVAEVNPAYRFDHVSGDVNVVTDGWQVDEDFVAAVSVQVSRYERRTVNGLLLDADTVVFAGWTRSAELSPDWSKRVLTVIHGGRAVSARMRAIRPVLTAEPGVGATPVLAMLRLLEPVPVPPAPLVFDPRPTPGARLLVSAHANQEPYSCLLEVKGRSGNLLRVTGEFVEGLSGAPAFSGAGALVGLVLTYRQGEKGFVLPVAALEEFVADAL
ncbi:hypothetical protein [Streptomyces sp. E-08]|uniref:hypothetical protein n=1 Tax=Streptomyces sp. E-08 TaxID=3404047 RepID=UPI003CF0A93F